MSGQSSAARARHAAVAAAALALALSGCSGKQRLAEYDFRNRTLAVVSIAPAYPEVLTGVSFSGAADNTPLAIARVGSEIAREASAYQMRPKLDAAARNVDVSGRMGERTLEGAARHLRTTPVESPARADFELEIRVRRYGIVARSWNANAYFTVDADLMLLDGLTGRRIWQTRVRQSDVIGPRILAAPDRAVSNVMTAIALAMMSQDDIERTLELLADYSADAMLNRLVRGLDSARR